MQMRHWILAAIGTLSAASFAHADTIITKDGRTLTGVVKKVANGYEIVADGKTSFIPTSDVKSIKLSNEGKVEEGDARERLASLRRSVEAETQIERIIERYSQFIEMNKDTGASKEASADLEKWKDRLAKGMMKVGKQWMTPAERDQYLLDSAKHANDIADQISVGDIAGANEKLIKLLEDNPQNISFAYLQGVVQMQRDRLNEARRSFDIVQEQVPDHAPTLLNQASLAVSFKRWPNALSLLERVMLLAPNNQQILDGVTDFIHLVPDATRRSAVFDRLMSVYAAQEAQLEKQMAAKGLYRFGSTWATQAKIEEHKKQVEAFEAKKAELQTTLDRSTQEIQSLQQRIARIEEQLRDIDRTRIAVDPLTGRTVYSPRPQYYYDLQNERDQYVRQIQDEQRRIGEVREQAKELEKTAPETPFAGRIVPIGEAGVPIVLPAATPPATRPAKQEVPPMLIPPASNGPTTTPTTRPTE